MVYVKLCASIFYYGEIMTFSRANTWVSKKWNNLFIKLFYKHSHKRIKYIFFTVLKGWKALQSCKENYMTYSKKSIKNFINEQFHKFTIENKIPMGTI